MTDTTLGQPKAALGVGSLIGESFSIFFRHFIPIIIIAYAMTVISVVISGLMVGFDVAMGIEQRPSNDVGDFILYYSTTLVKMAAGSLATALILQLAYDAKLHRPVSIARYVSPALSAFLPLVVLSVVQTILGTVGVVLLIVPGLWIYAVFSVSDPAVVIERAGFHGLHRSAALTKNYRWPIVGLLCLLLIFVVAITIATVFLSKIVVAFGGTVSAVILFSALTSVVTGFGSVLTALIYARLREIKDGVSIDQIVSVFD